jgi:hypothetical protein
MPTVWRSGSEEIVARGVSTSVGVWTRTTWPSSASIRVAGVLSRTSPPSSSMRAVIISHIWPGP